MLVKFRTNLGSEDGNAHGLDYTKCQIGMQLDVPEATGKWLIERGIAETTVKGVAETPHLKGVKKSDE